MLDLLYSLLIIFNIALPKAGSFISGLPITAGYCLLLLTLIGQGLFFWARKPLYCWPLAALALFNGVFIITFAHLNGIVSLAPFISYLLGFALLPAGMIIFLNPSSKLRLTFIGILPHCIRFISIFGICSFFNLMVSGEYLNIPFLTSTGNDPTPLEGKNNMRTAEWGKLISTYANGNIFGVCGLILLPLYDILEKRIFLRYIFRLSIVLTFSRTAWVVLFAYDLLSPRISLKFKAVALLLTTSVLAYIINYTGFNIGFIFDATLGGRASSFDWALYDLIPTKEFDYISEILLLSSVYAHGYFGGMLTLFLLLAAPILLLKQGNTSLIANQCGIGLLLYFLASFSDGAAIFIPVMLIYWLVYWIGMTDVHEKVGLAAQRGISKNPSRREPLRASPIPALGQ
jgi:hypothetical protein